MLNGYCCQQTYRGQRSPRIESLFHPYREKLRVLSASGHSISESQSISGFCNVKGVKKPSDFALFWKQAYRPLLDARIRSIAACGTGVRLPLLIDTLLAELRQIKTVSRHVEQRHEDLEWQEVGAEVVEAVVKYEQYVLRDCSLHTALSHFVRSYNAAGKADDNDSLSLARRLLALLSERGAQVEDEDWRARLAGQARVMDATWLEVVRLKERERELVAQAAQAMSDPLPMGSVVVDASLELGLTRSRNLEERQAEGHEHDTDMDVPEHSVASGLAAATGDPSESLEAQPEDTSTEVTYLLTRHVVAQVLTRHPDSMVRRDVFVQGAMALKSRLVDTAVEAASLRQAIARAQGERSWAAMVQRKMAAGSPNHVGRFLRQLAADLKPLADAQVAFLRSRDPSFEDWDVAYHKQQWLDELEVKLQEYSPYLCLTMLIEQLGKLMHNLAGINLSVEVPGESEVWSPRVVKVVVTLEGSEPAGIVYLDPGTSYGTRILFLGPLALSPPGPLFPPWPVVSVGLGDSWSGGHPASLSSLVELLHEMGHALHMVMSSRSSRPSINKGLGLPLDVLEVPSQLFEQFALDQRSLSFLCRHCETREALPLEAAEKLAYYLKAKHRSSIDLLDQVLCCMTDQLAAACQPHWAGWPGWRRICSRLSSLPASPVTVKQLALMPTLLHHQGLYYSYVWSLVTSLQFWHTHLEKDPIACDPTCLLKLLELGGDDEGVCTLESSHAVHTIDVVMRTQLLS